MTDKLKIMLVAGEASGDAHGARLVDALRKLGAGVEFEFFGSAGPKMRDSGVFPTVAADELSVVGVAEIASALPMFLNAKRTLERSAIEQEPDVAVLIDFPEFNLKLARSLKKQGIKVVYYISPQLWAWRKYRVNAIRKYVDLMLTILPFEKDWYSSRGVTHVEFIGNPLAAEVHSETDPSDFCLSAGLDPDRTLVALLPGSRRKEIERIFPIMIEAAKLVRDKIPAAQFVVALADGRQRAMVESQTSEFSQSAPGSIAIAEGRTYDALNAADAAAVTSGTATLEAAIIGTPMAIVYKTSWLNYALIKPLVSVEHYGLINLIAEKRLAAELIQQGLTPPTLCDEIVRLLDPAINRTMRTELNNAVTKLGTGGASERAADAILELMKRA